MSRILIIEDEISIAELERDYLELSGLRWRRRMMGRGALAGQWRRILIS